MNAVVFYFRCIFIFKNSMFLIVIAHVNDLLLSLSLSFPFLLQRTFRSAET